VCQSRQDAVPLNGIIVLFTGTDCSGPSLSLPSCVDQIMQLLFKCGRVLVRVNCFIVIRNGHLQ